MHIRNSFDTKIEQILIYVQCVVEFKLEHCKETSFEKKEKEKRENHAKRNKKIISYTKDVTAT